MIKVCSCPHESQDKIHGKGKRVYNKCKVNNQDGARCTVCKKEIVL